jgi:uncharacterized protein YbaR (Trm112 family)
VLIDLVDDLRCPRLHEETWLVASTSRTEGRDIIEGVLGCPICHAEYAIRDGVVWFVERGESVAAPDDLTPVADSDLALRLAALLDLSEAQGFGLLVGSWGTVAPLLRGVVPTHFVLLNPWPTVAAGDGISVLQAAPGIPLADATCRGVALDDRHADGVYLDGASRVLRPRGRLVAPTSSPTPTGFAELARDDRVWVAERGAAPPQVVPIRGRGR